MFFDIFCGLCEKKGVSNNRAATEIGLSSSTVTKWKNTGATPDGSTLAKVARYFGVTIDFLLGITPESYLFWSEHKLMQAERAYQKERDQNKREELQLEIDGWRESISDQKLSIALIDIGNQAKGKPIAQSDELGSELDEVNSLLSRATPEMIHAVLAILRASISPN